MKSNISIFQILRNYKNIFLQWFWDEYSLKKQNGKLSITFKTVFHVVSFPRIDDNFFVFQSFFVVIQQAFFANIHHLVLQNENIPKNYIYFTCYSNNLTKIINRIWNRQKPSFNIKSHITSFSFRFFKIK